MPLLFFLCISPVVAEFDGDKLKSEELGYDFVADCGLSDSTTVVLLSALLVR